MLLLFFNRQDSLPCIIVKSEAAHSFTSAKVGKTLSVVQIPSLSIVQFVLSDSSDVFTGQFAVSIWNAHEPKVVFKNLWVTFFNTNGESGKLCQKHFFTEVSTLLRNSNQIVTFVAALCNYVKLKGKSLNL